LPYLAESASEILICELLHFTETGIAPFRGEVAT